MRMKNKFNLYYVDLGEKLGCSGLGDIINVF